MVCFFFFPRQQISSVNPHGLTLSKNTAVGISSLFQLLAIYTALLTLLNFISQGFAREQVASSKLKLHYHYLIFLVSLRVKIFPFMHTRICDTRIRNCENTPHLSVCRIRFHSGARTFLPRDASATITAVNLFFGRNRIPSARGRPEFPPRTVKSKKEKGIADGPTIPCFPFLWASFLGGIKFSCPGA